MQIGDFTARIVVDDEELEEYHVELETPTRVTCWIASEAQKTFSIRWHCHAENRTAGNVGWVTIDGVCCDGLPMHPGPVGEGDTKEMYDVNASNKKARGFLFSHIQFSDDGDKEAPEAFGEIRLIIQHGDLVEADDESDDDSEDVQVLDGNDKFLESSSKAAHHRVVFGQERAQDCDLSVFTLDRNDEPSLFFVFKYRPIGNLVSVLYHFFGLLTGYLSYFTCTWFCSNTRYL
ncbi:hypothetical protein OG21DRAFT_1505389 [Imleria badia]|nr:hypothetical protein OG21DRAFT_1505389 [Imleria badia]